MKTMIVALLLTSACLPAAAANFDYSYLDLAYSGTHDDISTANANGYGVDGSWALGASGFTLETSYEHRSFGSLHIYPGATLTPESWNLGAGYHFALGNSLDFIAHADYSSAKTGFSVGSFRDSQKNNGYVFGVGVREELSDDFDLDEWLEHDDTGFNQFGPYTTSCGTGTCVLLLNWQQNGSENVVSAAARYLVTGALGVGLEYRHSSLEGANEWLLSARWNF